MSRWDVVVIGAGPAGALSARELARSGVRVLLLERARLPRRKVCGGCLGPAAASVLERAGLGGLPSERGARPLTRMRLAGGGREAWLPLEGTRALSRRALDGALTEAAVAAGATLRDGVTARLGEISDSEVRLRARSVEASEPEEEFAASIVIDAGGLGGGLTLSSGESGPDRIAPASRIGVGARFEGDDLPIPPGELHMVVGDGGYVGLVRIEDGTLNVAAALDPARLRGSDPGGEVARLLDGSGIRLDEPPVEGWRGTPPLTRSPAGPPPPRIFRLGDAAGYVEPFTGEGIGWALADALRVAPVVREALSRWDPELARRWDHLRRARAHSETRLCRALAWGVRRPSLVGASLHFLQAAPGLAAPLRRQTSRTPELP